MTHAVSRLRMSPALGITWANQLLVRLLADRQRPEEAPLTPPGRTLRVVFAPTCRPHPAPTRSPPRACGGCLGLRAADCRVQAPLGVGSCPCCRSQLGPSAETPLDPCLRGQPVQCAAVAGTSVLALGTGGPLRQELLPRPSSPRPRPALLHGTRALCLAQPRPSGVEARGPAVTEDTLAQFRKG